MACSSNTKAAAGVLYWHRKDIWSHVLDITGIFLFVCLLFFAILWFVSFICNHVLLYESYCKITDYKMTVIENGNLFEFNSGFNQTGHFFGVHVPCQTKQCFAEILCWISFCYECAQCLSLWIKMVNVQFVKVILDLDLFLLLKVCSGLGHTKSSDFLVFSFTVNTVLGALCLHSQTQFKWLWRCFMRSQVNTHLHLSKVTWERCSFGLSKS